VPRVDPLSAFPTISFIDSRGEERLVRADAACLLPFETARPVRSFPSWPGKRSYSGWWWCATTSGHVGFESWLERDHVMLLDFDRDVVGIASQPFWLHFPPRDGLGSHAPDFFARTADGAAVVIDVRPAERIDKRDAAVFAATGRVCAELGWSYRLVHDLERVVTLNIRWLAGYRHPRHAPSDAARSAILHAAAGGRTLHATAATAGDPRATLPAVYHLLWTGVLRADLARGALSMASLLHPAAAQTR
jgi:hypothetical protein